MQKLEGSSLPPVAFSEWRKWRVRERASDQFDVPREFGILGLYVLGTWDGSPGSGPADKRHLAPDVVYIGMSDHVLRRLERTHAAVQRYRVDFNDPLCSRLHFAQWESAWTNFGPRKGRVVQAAVLRALEAHLIAEYAMNFGRLPALNRQ